MKVGERAFLERRHIILVAPVERPAGHTDPQKEQRTAEDPVCGRVGWSAGRFARPGGNVDRAELESPSRHAPRAVIAWHRQLIAHGAEGNVPTSAW